MAEETYDYNNIGTVEEGVKDKELGMNIDPEILGKETYDYSRIGAVDREPTGIVRYMRDKAIEAEEKLNRPSIGKVVETAISDNWIIPAVSRMIDRSGREVDEDFFIDPEMQAKIDQDYNQDESKYLQESKSKEDYLGRLKDIEEDKERDMILARAGATGTVASLTASVLDPVTWATGYGFGKLAAVGKAANNARVAKAALLSGAENAIVESILVHNDTQSSFNDVIIAAAGGAVLGAGGAAFTGIRSVRSKLAKEDLKAKINSSIREAGEAGKMSEILEATIPEGSKSNMHKVYPDADHSEAFRNNTEYRKNLVSRAKGTVSPEVRRIIDAEAKAKQTLGELRVSSKADAAASNPKIIEINNKISELEIKLKASKSGKSGIRKKIDNLKAELKLNSPGSSQALDSAMAALARAKELRISAVGNKTPAELKSLMSGHTDALKAKADLEAWDNMTEVQKTKVSSPEGLSNIKIKAEQEKARVNAIAADDTELDAVDTDDLDADELDDLTPEDEAAYLLAQARGKIREIVESGADPKQASSEFDEYYQLALEEYYDQIGSDFKMKLGHQEPTSFNSVGAAGTGFNPNEVYKLTPEETEVVNGLIDTGSNLDSSYIPVMPKTPILKEIFSIATRLLNSESLAVRGLASKIVESPQGGKQAGMTVAGQVSVNNRLIKAAGGDRYNQALEAHLKGSKLSVLDIVKREEELVKFNELVLKELSSPSSMNINKNVKEAADAIREQLRVGRKMQQDAKYEGFDKVNLDDGYAPIVIDHNKIKMGILEHGEEKMKKLIYNAYSFEQADGSIMTPIARDILADIHMAKARNNGLTLRDKVNTEDTLEQAALKLRKLFPKGNEPIIIGFIKDVTASTKALLTRRAAGINTLSPKLIQSEGLDMVKFINSDVSIIMEGFTREAAANTSLGQLGFKSRKDLLETINLVEKHAINKGLDPKKIREEIEILDLVQKMIHGDPTDELSAKARNRIGSVKKLVAIRDLAASGLSQFAEVGNLLSRRSWGQVWDSMSIKEFFKPAWVREGKKGLGVHERADFAEIDTFFGFPGEDHVLFNNRLSNEFVADSLVSGSAAGRRFHNAVDRMGRWSNVLSTMKNTQSALDKIALRAVAGEVKSMALAGKVTLRRAEINRAGWSDGFLEDKLIPWMKENPGTARFDGRDISTFNFYKMPADMQLRVVSGIQRLAYADIQKSMIGELPKAMSHTVGRLITQHRSFQIGSMEKQLVHGIRHDKIALASTLALSTFTAGISVALKSAHRNLGKEDGWEKFQEEMDISNGKTWWTIASNIGALSSLGIIGDLASTFGALPKEWSETGGFRQMGATSIPVLGYARDVAAVPKAAFKMAYGDGENEEAQKLMHALHKAIPGLNMIGINQALNAIEADMKN